MRRIPRRSRVVVSFVVSGIFVVAVAAAGWMWGPSVYRALVPQFAATQLTLTLEDDTTTATVEVPQGWSYRLPFNDPAGVDLTSPDGELEVGLRLHAQTDAETAIAESAPGGFGVLNVEQSTNGELLHAQTTDGAAVVGGLAVGPHTVSFVSSSAPEYGAELARLLAGMRIEP